MTDGAALPIVISDLVHTLRERGVVDVTITAGHAFGGDLEAVTVPSALTVARHLARADVAVVAMGPGVVGTGTALGTTAIEAAAVLDAAAALGGEAILCVRASNADTRQRHQGVSHHTDSVLRLVRSPAVAAPLDGEVDGVPDAAAVLDELGIAVTTMGRGPADDPLFFATAAAAGTLAARHIDP